MADILDEWLKPAIIREISNGLQWLESTSIDSTTNISHFEDDGSTLRAKISRAHIAQMTKFISFEESIEAWISDSITRLRASFAASAVHRYHQKTRKRLTEDSLGGIIQITDFEILATHIGPRPSRLTILIKDFQSVGSGGSGVFGVPRPLSDLPEIIELLDRLKTLRSKECCEARQNPITGEDAEDGGSSLGTQSEIESFSPSDRSRPASQENFATQVPRSRLVKSLGLHVHNSRGTSHHRKSHDSPTSEKITKNPSDSSSKPLETLSGTIKANATADANANAVKSASHLQMLGSPLRKSPGKGKNQFKRQNNPNELLELLSNNQGLNLSKRSKGDAPAVYPGDNNRDSTSQIESPKLDKEGGKAQTILARNEIISERQVPSVRSTPRVTPCIEELNGEAEVLNLAKPVREVELVSFPSSSRIRCREVKISKDQQKLLNRSDSWIPAEPGQRKPVGNIPVKILKSISDQVEGSSRYWPIKIRPAIQPTSRVESAASDSSLTSESEACQDSEPEIPISPENWPPSSPPEQIREQLPPDSSMAAPLQAIQAEKEEGEGFSAQKRRKLSNSPASFASAKADSENLSPNQKKLKKTNGSPSALPATPSRQSSSEPEEQMTTKDQRSPAKFGHDKCDIQSATSNAHTPTYITSGKSIANMSTLSQEGAYGNLDQHISPVRPHNRTPSTLSHHIEFKDHSSQEKMNESLKRRGEFSGTILPIDTNVVIDSPEDVREPLSPKIEIASMQLSNTPEEKRVCEDALQQAYQSTATRNDEPVLQVKATPYVNGHLSKSAYIDRRHCVSPSRKKDSLLSDHTRFHESDEMLQSPSIIEISSAQISSSKPTEDVLAEFSSSEMGRRISTSADLVPADLGVPEVADYQNSGIAYGSLNNTTHVEDTFVSASAPPEISSGDYIAENPPINAEGDTQKPKRKFLELHSSSLETAKRHKQVQSSTFKSNEDPQTMVDPSILGDKYRQDFYNSRESFNKSHMNEAPNSPTVISQSLTPSSHAIKLCNEGFPKGKVEIDAPLHYTSPKQTPLPDPGDIDMGEAISKFGDEKQLEMVTFGERRIAEKTGRSLNVTLEMPVDQIADHVQVQDAEYNLPKTNVGCSIKLTVFDQFRATYRDYVATSQQFTAICRKIERLVKDGHMLHQYLWDDFIIRHKTEYPTYLGSCAEKAEDPLPYEQFYHKYIVKPLFTDGVVRPENISQVFLPSQQIASTGDQRFKQQRENVMSFENIGRKPIMSNATSSPKASDNAQKPTSPEVTVDVTIDLTSDEEVFQSAQRQNLIDFARRKSPRSLPWITGRSRVENTPTKKTFSRASSSTHISHSPFRSTPVSNIKPQKASYNVSSSPKKVASGNDQASEISTRTETIVHESGAENTFQASRSKRNISPILRQSLSRKGLESRKATEAQTPEKVPDSNTTPNRDLRLRSSLVPEQQKESRKNHSSTPQADKLSSPKPFSLSPQESSKQSKHQSEKTQTQPEAQKNDENNNNNTFSRFAKAYAAIRNGNRNSYARDKQALQTDDDDTRQRHRHSPGNVEGSSLQRKKEEEEQIDVMRWRL